MPAMDLWVPPSRSRHWRWSERSEPRPQRRGRTARASTSRPPPSLLARERRRVPPRRAGERGGSGAPINSGSSVARGRRSTRWQVAITFNPEVYAGDGYQRQFCGGTLVASKMVVSAAHCFYDSAGLVAGGKDTCQGEGPAPGQKRQAQPGRCEEGLPPGQVGPHRGSPGGLPVLLSQPLPPPP